MLKNMAGVNPKGRGFICPLPDRDSEGFLHFNDYPEFRPTLSPLQILKCGAFGGGGFRDMYSSLNKTTYTETWKELPEEWLEQLDLNMLTQTQYQPSLNKYGVRSEKGTPREDVWGIEYWTSQGWIQPQDPYGWFMWYYRFYLGRRSDDDDRQIQKWVDQCGENGRLRINLIGLCLHERKPFDDYSTSPYLRQCMMHYGYELNETDFLKGVKLVMEGASYIPLVLLPPKEEMAMLMI
jgi:hypothetical protein